MIYAIYSDRPRCGKSTFRQALTSALAVRDGEYSTEHIPFADRVKRLTEHIIDALPISSLSKIAACDNMWQGDKSYPIMNMTVRQLLQFAGTDLGRNKLHPDIWVTAWLEEIQPYLRTGTHIVVDDMRFENEYDMCKSLGAKFIKIINTNALQSGHESEGRLSNRHFDYVFDNSAFDMSTLNAFATLFAASSCQTYE